MEHFPIVNRLHSDVLEDTYGPISAKVLRHDKEIRESHLIDSSGTSRTYAITFFSKWDEKRIIDINEQIKNGAPIGKAFRKFGYHIRKNVIAVYIVALPSWLRKDFKVKGKYAKARLSEFYACKENEAPVIYGTVVEIYSPDFRPSKINETDRLQVNPVTREFEKIGVSKKEIWKRIGRNNDWTDIPQTYSSAKKASRDDIFRFKKRIEKIIKER